MSPPRVAKPIPFWVWATIAGAGVTMFIVVLLTILNPPWRSGEGRVSIPPAAKIQKPATLVDEARLLSQALQTWTRMSQLWMILKAHGAETNEPLTQLEDLVRAGAIPASSLKDAWLRYFEYNAEAETITSLGPDGQLNTEDDLVRSTDSGPELPAYYQEIQQRMMHMAQQQQSFPGQ